MGIYTIVFLLTILSSRQEEPQESTDVLVLTDDTI